MSPGRSSRTSRACSPRTLELRGGRGRGLGADARPRQPPRARCGSFSSIPSSIRARRETRRGCAEMLGSSGSEAAMDGGSEPWAALGGAWAKSSKSGTPREVSRQRVQRASHHARAGHWGLAFHQANASSVADPRGYLRSRCRRWGTVSGERSSPYAEVHSKRRGA